jgi:5-methylcytosine-specific restriction endonuclease McrA
VTSFPKPERRATTKRRKRLEIILARMSCFNEVYERAKGHCERCGVAVDANVSPVHPQRAHMNHKVPLSRGGKDDPDNCELICQSCHMPKGQHAPTPARLDQVRRRKPVDWP